MSKAFTRESEHTTDPVIRARGPDLPPGARNYLTPGGARRLRDELDRLLHSERPAAAADPSADLDELDRRIEFLTAQLDDAEVVDAAQLDPDRVHFGTTVTATDQHGRPHTYRIVGLPEADPRHGLVSWMSPVARALMDSRVGDLVTVRTPRGEDELTIERIEHDPT